MDQTKTNICMFMGSRSPNAKHVIEAEQLAKGLAAENFGLVWGGQDSGLMKSVGDIFARYKETKADMIGITTKQIRQFCNDMHPACTQTLVAEDERERHKFYSENADAYILLPGAVGSFGEAMSIFEQTYVDMHQTIRSGKPYTVKPFILLNIDGYYEGTIKQFREMMGLGNHSENTYMGEKVSNLFYPNDPAAQIGHGEALRFLLETQKQPIIICP